jgi:hypothetical protein
LNFLKIFSKNIQITNFMKIRSVEVMFLPRGRADIHTHIHEETDYSLCLVLIVSGIFSFDTGIWRRSWERLKAGESNGKLALRTCLERSVPEPYRSPDWALVPAKLA